MSVIIEDPEANRRGDAVLREFVGLHAPATIFRDGRTLLDFSDPLGLRANSVRRLRISTASGLEVIVPFRGDLAAHPDSTVLDQLQIIADRLYPVPADADPSVQVLMEDAAMGAEGLKAKYANGEVSGEYPVFPRAQWRDAVANGETSNGYWDWASYRLDERMDELGLDPWEEASAQGDRPKG